MLKQNSFWSVLYFSLIVNYWKTIAKQTLMQDLWLQSEAPLKQNPLKNQPVTLPLNSN